MAQNKKKISKAYKVRYQWIRQRIEAGELDPGASNTTVTYPQFTTSVQLEPTQVRDAMGTIIDTNAPSTVPLLRVSSVLHSLEYRKAWNKIANDYNNRS